MSPLDEFLREYPSATSTARASGVVLEVQIDLGEHHARAHARTLELAEQIVVARMREHLRQWGDSERWHDGAELVETGEEC